MALLISRSTNPKIAFIVILLFTLTACQQATIDDNAIKIEDDLGQIIITDTSVTVAPKHIAHIKSERYQPSLSLYGKLKPAQQVTISPPQRIYYFLPCLLQNIKRPFIIMKLL